MQKNNWKIVYSTYAGMQKRAVELLSHETGKYLVRDPGMYTFHAIECAKAGCCIDMNAIVIGTYEENTIFSRYLKKEEIPHNGYVVTVKENEDNPAYKLVLICGDNPSGVFYGAVDFVDDCLVEAAPLRDGKNMPHELFVQPLPSYYSASAPAVRTRSVFAWGHSINNYCEYIENLARLRFNQLILWNDYLPLNAEDIVECAHSYGIEVLWGFAWGWSTDCTQIDLSKLQDLKNSVIDKYNKIYKNAVGDGIYFQSFTELKIDQLEGRRISEAVTELVNMTVEELLRDNPDLHIQFGLHASSVWQNLDDISRVDKRVEILWEDCGAFPYGPQTNIHPLKVDDSLQNCLAFTNDILDLRSGSNVGVVYKCQMTMDWTPGRFFHQTGRYVLGMESDEVRNHDLNMLKPIWRYFQSEWIQRGGDALMLTQQIVDKTNGDVTLCVAATLTGGIWLPTALCAQMMWDCSGTFEDMLRKVTKRHCITFA